MRAGAASVMSPSQDRLPRGRLLGRRVVAPTTAGGVPRRARAVGRSATAAASAALATATRTLAAAATVSTGLSHIRSFRSVALRRRSRHRYAPRAGVKSSVAAGARLVGGTDWTKCLERSDGAVDAVLPTLERDEDPPVPGFLGEPLPLRVLTESKCGVCGKIKRLSCLRVDHRG